MLMRPNPAPETDNIPEERETASVLTDNVNTKIESAG